MSQIHQLLPAAVPGDAITQQALQWQAWLQAAGHDSAIYAATIDPALSKRVKPLRQYRAAQQPLLIYHHSLGFPAIDSLPTPPLLLVYHNITPPEFLATTDPAQAAKLAAGRTQLAALNDRCCATLSDSGYNAAELATFGYAPSTVIPLTIPDLRAQTVAADVVAAREQMAQPRLLFVGRLAPNKRQDDLLLLLAALRQRRPDATLTLVGRDWTPGYSRWLRLRATQLDLGDALIMTGPVSDAALRAYLQASDFYVSMSEHEGFGQPLLEAMQFGLPVLAYAAAAVPETMGPAGLLLHEKEFATIAALIDVLCDMPDVTTQLRETGRLRAASFFPAAVRPRWEAALNAALEVVA